jgi:hypothetical protein
MVAISYKFSVQPSVLTNSLHNAHLTYKIKIPSINVSSTIDESYTYHTINKIYQKTAINGVLIKIHTK